MTRRIVEKDIDLEVRLEKRQNGKRAPSRFIRLACHPFRAKRGGITVRFPPRWVIIGKIEVVKRAEKKGRSS